MALVRQSPMHQDTALIQSGIAGWNQHMAILDAQLAKTAGFAAGESFTLADVVLGLSMNRWFMTDFDKPSMPNVTAYYERLSERSGYLEHGRNGLV